MSSELRVDKIHNEGGDNDSGIDLSTNDQIVLKTANTTRLTMNATGQVTIIGENGANTNLQQGLTKGWGESAANGASIADSFNVSSLTDTATGRQNWNFTINMEAVAYSAHITIMDDNLAEPFITSRSTSEFEGYMFSGSTAADKVQAVSWCGDLT